MRIYERYQNTPYTWLVKAPKHWLPKTIRSITQLSNKRCGDRKFTLLSVYREYGVIPKSSRDDNHNVESENLSNYKIVAPGDLVLNKMKMWQGSLGVSKFHGIVSPAYIVCNIIDKSINTQYLHLLLRSVEFKTYYNQFSYGVRVGQWDMHYDDFKKLQIYLPPREEQDQIVHYLDWQTSQINKLIVSKKKQMEALKEHELCVRNSLLTKGVNSNICFQETGSNWMGKIPAHWKVSRIVKHFTIKKRIAGKEGYDVLSITQQGLKVKDISKNEGQMAANYAGYQFVYPGDFAMNHMDLLTGYIDISKQFGVTSPDYRVFVLDDKENCFPEYYLQLFQMCYKRKIFYGYGRGAANQGRWRMPAVNFRNFEIPFPPYEEQVLISEKIKGISVQTESVCKKLDEEIRVLSELKNRLVSDVVTGQIDVRGIKVPEFELMEEIVDDANPTDDITEVE